ncbi:hypothetical protein [Bacillus suaedae]|uniref:Uncharacterized protein n=1 Tax=Halalkalibacter suaedae TaxID=2822140 RepID=A0A941ANE8_9BACI|nr:hypothetical protein [Bacillus suaedae]MBP3950247.1 hypothetical protein [Bacillus suaedae]
MLERFQFSFGVIWVISLTILLITDSNFFQMYILLSLFLWLLVKGSSEYKKDSEAFLPYWYFIMSGITLLIAILLFF